MDVDAVVARWVAAYLASRMDGPGLVGALRDLGTQVPVRHAGTSDRVASLVAEMEAAVSGPDPDRAVERVATRFLGRPPADVVAASGEPDWHLRT